MLKNLHHNPSEIIPIKVDTFYVTTFLPPGIKSGENFPGLDGAVPFYRDFRDVPKDFNHSSIVIMNTIDDFNMTLAEPASYKRRVLLLPKEIKSPSPKVTVDEYRQFINGRKEIFKQYEN